MTILIKCNGKNAMPQRIKGRWRGWGGGGAGGGGRWGGGGVGGEGSICTDRIHFHRRCNYLLTAAVKLLQ